MILTKRDVLPSTLSDEKILAFVQDRLKEEGIQVKEILICGYLLKHDEESTRNLSRIVTANSKVQT